jgi:hypothetical protein
LAIEHIGKDGYRSHLRHTALTASFDSAHRPLALRDIANTIGTVGGGGIFSYH